MKRTLSSPLPLRRLRAGACLPLVAFATLAAQPHSHNDVVDLEPVVVTARPSERPLAVSTDPRAPAQPIPAQDGAEVLRGIAGFSVIRKGGTDGDPVLRGMAGSRLGILLDGENILGGCSNRMDPPTAYVFPAAYDRITVLKGPQSVLHGPGNSAGVVLFERTPERLAAPATQAVGALTFGSADRNDQWLQLRAGRPVGYAEAAFTRTEAGDYRDGDGRAVPSAYERWSARAALGWTPADDTRVELSGLLSDGQAAYADRMMDGSKFDRRNLSLRFRHAPGAAGIDSLEASVFVNAVDHVMDNFSLRPFTPSMMMPGRAASNPDRLTYGGRLLAGFAPGERLRLMAGVDHQANRHRVRSTSDDVLRPYAAAPRVRDANFADSGLFAETTWLVSERSRVVAGARLDFWRAKDYRTAIAAGMGTAANPTAGSTRTDALPHGFLRYEQELRSGLTLFAGAGHVQRFPDYWELFAKESARTLSAFDTRPERTTQVDLGLTYRAGPIAAALSFFANRIDDFILIESGVAKAAGMGATRTATISRNVDAATHGGEASLAWNLAPGWTLDASLAAVHGTNRTDARPLAQQPPLEGRLGLSYATPRWSVGSLARLVGRQDRYALNQGNIVGQDLGPSPGFAVFSFNAAWKPTARLQVSAGLDNAFDKTYAEHLSRGGSFVAGFPPPSTRINEPGRTGWVKLDFTY